MDAKLARGLTRHGFRHDLKAVEQTQDAFTAVLSPYVENTVTLGKLTKAEGKQAISRVFAFKSHPHHTVFVDRFAKPDIKALSPDFDEAVVGGNLSSRLITLFGHEEHVRSYSLFYDRFSRKSIDLRLLEYPVYVRQHAVSRYLERANASYDGVTRSLWPGLLVLEALDRFGEPAIAHPFMIPASGGAFLGMAAMETSPDAIRVERCVFSKGDVRESTHPETTDTLMPIWFLSTYLHADELKPSQVELRNALVSLVERHRGVLMVAHLMRIMSLGLEPDDLGLEERFSGDVHAAHADFRALFESHLWNTVIRLPSETPFSEHIEAQRHFERVGREALQ